MSRGLHLFRIMSSHHAITREADQLQSLVRSAIAGKDDMSATRRATVRQTFTAMSQLVDTAMIRTAGVVDILSENQSMSHKARLFGVGHVKAGHQLAARPGSRKVPVAHQGSLH